MGSTKVDRCAAFGACIEGDRLGSLPKTRSEHRLTTGRATPTEAGELSFLGALVAYGFDGHGAELSGDIRLASKENEGSTFTLVPPNRGAWPGRGASK